MLTLPAPLPPQVGAARIDCAADQGREAGRRTAGSGIVYMCRVLETFRLIAVGLELNPVLQLRELSFESLLPAPLINGFGMYTIEFTIGNFCVWRF